LLSLVGHSSLEVHIGVLRTDEHNPVANSTTDGCWREYYARNYEGKRHADKNKNKAVAGKLALGFFVRCLVDMTWSPPDFQPALIRVFVCYVMSVTKGTALSLIQYFDYAAPSSPAVCFPSLT
jgi:hypothetical protein